MFLTVVSKIVILNLFKIVGFYLFTVNKQFPDEQNKNIFFCHDKS